MKVLITGGAGFIGSHVVSELLKENYDVFVLDNFSTGRIKNLEDQTEIKRLICADINDSSVVSIIQEINPDYMIHLAAQPSVAVSQQNPLLDVETNMYGLVNVLEAARRTDCRKFVFATSGGTIYGNVENEQLPLVEDLPLKACSFYGLTKLTAIHYLDLYKEHFGLDYCALALGNIYGPRQDPYGESGVIAIFTNKIINNEDCTINGDGSVTRDYLYVKDAAVAFVKSLEQGSGLLNLGTGIETSVLEVFNVISSVSGKETRVKYRAASPGEVQRVSLCIDKIQDQMNWSPQVRFPEGIRLTYEWFLTPTKEVQHVRSN
ncbi:NAD-dependent epimerase/dehydratase family protein [Paenibacillus amylolyticus]|jgi:UDP-glucose 4-epimerase|uniref:NAD-dependent epimerase/dehydratase family protein n=1 Tax=Paenibacillus amylolyticus TaxID=1451 RepID=A0A5M9WQF9_PAEAM|nr:GDP-mannose 4,6-dehydratase [Paenibacillus amylolyticus]KAA8783802.1 NAD-dependent epimerase/dehydratase family protein [Paenibacillus amylolyticus]